MNKSNVVDPNDEDFKKLTTELIKKQLEEDPDYDGSSLVLGRRDLSDNN